MIDLFIKGGPIMWPILILSLAAITVILERAWFLLIELKSRQNHLVEQILADIETGQIEVARQRSQGSRDFIARTIHYALGHEDRLNALLRAAGRELQRYNRGLAFLDTTVTVAPLLGLLGTVSGMIHSFGLLGENELGAPAAITGGIAEALIATAFGLVVAIVALLPFNFLNARLEQARHELQDAASQIESQLRSRPTTAS